MVKDIISFEIYGKVAHFRKFYSNASALTYSLPPRSTIIGILASILGYERDTYYESLDKFLIGVQILNPIKKVFQRMNYLKIESKNINEFSGTDNRSQISVELIFPNDIKTDNVSYRIFVGVKDKNDFDYIKLKENFKESKFLYGISLGTANCIAYIKNYVSSYDFNKIEEFDKPLIVNSITPIDWVDEIISLNNKDTLIEQDIFPTKLSIKNSDVSSRIAKETTNMVYPLYPSGMNIQLKNTAIIYSLKGNDGDLNIALI